MAGRYVGGRVEKGVGCIRGDHPPPGQGLGDQRVAAHRLLKGEWDIDRLRLKPEGHGVQKATSAICSRSIITS